MKFSCMTMSMAMPLIIKNHYDKNTDSLKHDYLSMLDDVARAGYLAVDIMDAEVRIFGREVLKEELAKRGLRVACYLRMQGYGCENVEACVENAVFLGADVLMLTPAYTKEMEGLSGNAIRQNLIDGWKEITSMAKAKGLHVVVEDTPDLRLHFCSMQEVEEVLNGVEGLELVYDSGNMLLVGEDPVAYYEHFADRTIHVHLKDMASSTEDKCAFPGTGLVDLKAVMQALKAHDYCGWITLEFSPEDARGMYDSLRDALVYVKSLCEQ